MSAVVEKKVLEKSIASRIPFADYVAIDATSITKLKELRRSPQHFKYRASHPKETAPLTLGASAHCATLEPERFYRDTAVWQRRGESGNLCPRNGKFWDAFRTEHAGKTIITEDEFVETLDIQSAVRSNVDAMRYLKKGDPEVSMLWPFFGRQCKGRVDWLTKIDGVPALVGLKTSVDCRLFQFGSQAARMGYHLQWAFYHDGYETITGVAPRMFEIVVESAPPHAVVVYRIPNEIILQGRDEYTELMKMLAECERNNDWPGPAVGEQELTLPSWVYGQQNDDLADLDLE